MNQRGKDDARGPKPEWLAAYVDGELDAASRKEVESWLTDHPEATQELEAQRRLARLCQASSPPENGLEARCATPEG